MVRLALHLFFRRIEVEARHNIPSAGPVIFAPNHTNALVDPLLLVVSMSRVLTLTAKNVLAKNPLLRWLMSATGVVTFHRREDAGGGANLRQNVRSLQICREILAGGGAVCIFPEGISHSDPRLRTFHVGPARLAVDFVRKNGNPGALGIVPVGLLYTEKDRMRSAVWLRFGEPIERGALAWRASGCGPRGVDRGTPAARRRVDAELPIAAPVGRAHLGGRDRRHRGPSARALGWSGPTAAEWFRLLGRLQAGYAELCATQPEMIVELTRRIRRYRAQLKRTAISPGEVYLPIRFGRAALFVIREFELLVIGATLGALRFPQSRRSLLLGQVARAEALQGQGPLGVEHRLPQPAGFPLLLPRAVGLSLAAPAAAVGRAVYRRLALHGLLCPALRRPAAAELAASPHLSTVPLPPRRPARAGR